MRCGSSRKSIDPRSPSAYPSHERLRNAHGPRKLYGRTTGVVVPKAATAVNLDPNTHAFVLATAFFTSLLFALAAWLPCVLLLRYLLFG